MKFLFEFVACCASPVPDEDIVPDRRSETRALMVAPSRRRCKRKKRTSNSNSSSAQEWRPSLTSISEDQAALEDRKLKRRTHGGDSRSPRRSTEDRRDHFTAIPTFSATPFMF